MSKLDTALATLTPDTREEFDECAGIMEFCGGLSRIEAERAAWRIVVQKRGYPSSEGEA